jgi:hypothetical protein
MATIGTFKKTGTEYTGEIFTLSLQAKGVRLVPDLRASGENAPSHRVLVGRATRSSGPAPTPAAATDRAQAKAPVERPGPKASTRTRISTPVENSGFYERSQMAKAAWRRLTGPFGPVPRAALNP